jgi:hypothetical protein
VTRKRHRSKQTVTLRDWLAAFAMDAPEKASQLPAGKRAGNCKRLVTR